jgi:hypothetical protein
MFLHSLNSEAATRTFKLEAGALSLLGYNGLVATPIPFTVNLICTIDAVTFTNPASSYCHQALPPVYNYTLITPVYSISPNNCAGLVHQLSLVNTDNIVDQPYDPTIIKINTTGPDYMVDT